MSELSHQAAYRLIHYKNQLTAAEQHALKMHLSQCAACRQHAIMAGMLDKILVLNPVRHRPQSMQMAAYIRAANRNSRRRQIMKPINAAAGMAVLFLLILVPWFLMRSGQEFTTIEPASVGTVAIPVPEVIPIATAVPLTKEPDPTSSAEEMIEPGDMLGEMAFTTAEEGFWSNNLNTLCETNGNRTEVDENVYEVECELFAGSQMLLNCSGVQADSIEELDAEWPTLKTEMIFDGQRINLPPFGSLDIEPYYESFNKIRVWNVLLKNIALGDHTLYCTGELADEMWETTYHFTVIEPADIEIPPNADELLFYGESDKFNTLAEFYDLLQSSVDNGQVYAVWNPVKATGQMPLIFGDYAVFLYRSWEDNVLWHGSGYQEPYVRQGKSDLWMLLMQLESGTTLEYRIIDGTAQILDPVNPLSQNGLYPTSIVQMP